MWPRASDVDSAFEEVVMQINIRTVRTTTRFHLKTAKLLRQATDDFII